MGANAGVRSPVQKVTESFLGEGTVLTVKNKSECWGKWGTGLNFKSKE